MRFEFGNGVPFLCPTSGVRAAARSGAGPLVHPTLVTVSSVGFRFRSGAEQGLSPSPRPGGPPHGSMDGMRLPPVARPAIRAGVPMRWATRPPVCGGAAGSGQAGGQVIVGGQLASRVRAGHPNFVSNRLAMVSDMPPIVCGRSSQCAAGVSRFQKHAATSRRRPWTGSRYGRCYRPVVYPHFLHMPQGRIAVNPMFGACTLSRRAMAAKPPTQWSGKAINPPARRVVRPVLSLYIRMSFGIFMRPPAPAYPGTAARSNVTPACSRMKAFDFVVPHPQQVNRAHGVVLFGGGAGLVSHDLSHDASGAFHPLSQALE